MSNVFDLAKYILQKQGSMTTVKLQKLVYYSQAWALVWDEEPIFAERIEAWISGPVVPELFAAHRGLYVVNEKNISGDPDNLRDYHKETVDVVLKELGDQSSQWLVDLTHHEDPWINAREGIPPDVRGNREIPLSEIAEYYNQLQS